jgi:hypothetical protein
MVSKIAKCFDKEYDLVETIENIQFQQVTKYT